MDIDLLVAHAPFDSGFQYGTGNQRGWRVVVIAVRYDTFFYPIKCGFECCKGLIFFQAGLYIFPARVLLRRQTIILFMNAFAMLFWNQIVEGLYKCFCMLGWILQCHFYHWSFFLYDSIQIFISFVVYGCCLFSCFLFIVPLVVKWYTVAFDLFFLLLLLFLIYVCVKVRSWYKPLNLYFPWSISLIALMRFLYFLLTYVLPFCVNVVLMIK